MSATAWRCDVCHRPIRAGTGYIALLAVSEDGVVGGYPQVPTPEDTLPEPPGGWPGGMQCVSLAELVALGESQHRVAVRAVHGHCDTETRPGYEFDVRRARTLAQWCEWVLHVGAKDWMGRRDVLAMLEYWWRNRGERRRPV